MHQKLPKEYLGNQKKLYELRDEKSIFKILKSTLAFLETNRDSSAHFCREEYSIVDIFIHSKPAL